MELEELFQVPVIEAYGMTEASHQIASNPLPPHRRKAGSVGMATGTEIAIMSESGEFLPSGETGEIVIRGSSLTRGYENDPATNRNAFVQGWFKTGDLGYLDDEGYLFITARLKEIINRGGEKISPAEVDRVLMDHPAVAQATTFAMPHGKLGEDVAAAVVLRAGVSATERDLREFTALRLAEYKVPGRVVIVDEIPKSATGKLQRVGLAEKLGLDNSDRTELAPKAEFTAPRTEVEDVLAKIWLEILRVGPIGIHDNFFDLGGDSILAARIIARVRDIFGAELSFFAFFDAPTVAEMAAVLDRPGSGHSDADLPRLTRVPRAGELPLSFVQQRIWFFDQLEPGSPLYNRPAFLRLKGRLDASALEHAFSEIVRRHEAVRTTFPAVDGRPRQVVSTPQHVTVAVVDLTGLPEAAREEEARRVAIDESLRPFDLAADLLLRAKLLRLGEADYLLILTTHHIAFDGWSDGVLFEELSAIYKSSVAGLPSPLAELPIQYADFALWQRASMQGPRFEESLAYWKEQLAGAPRLLNLPTDRPRPRVQTFRGARHLLALPEALTAALTKFSRREGGTLYMTLLAAFKVLLSRYSGQSDIIVGTPVAGRDRVETEKLIGAFINTLVLRTDLSGNPSFRELLRRVRKVSLEGQAQANVPIEKLMEALQPERDMASNPLFQVMFQLRNTPEQTLELPAVAVEEWNLDTGLAKLDLTLEAAPEGDGLSCRFYYNSDLFDESTIARMAEGYQRLLAEFVGNPERRLDELTAPLEMAEPFHADRRFEPGEEIVYQRSNLTRNQLLIWTEQKLYPEVPLYNMAYAFHLDGEVDRGHFERAFRTLVNSSDALRTVLHEIDGIPQQHVLREVDYEIDFYDFSSLPDPGAASQTWLETRCKARLDLEKALFDCALAKISDRKFLWYLNVHHVVIDGRSFELIFNALSEFYARSLEGRLDPDIRLPAFRDYVELKGPLAALPRVRKP
jgi:acyl carrier protein